MQPNLSLTLPGSCLPTLLCVLNEQWKRKVNIMKIKRLRVTWSEVFLVCSPLLILMFLPVLSTWKEKRNDVLYNTPSSNRTRHIRQSISPTSVSCIPLTYINGEMQLKPIELSPDVSEEPLQMLSAALKQNPKSTKFRVSWYVVLGSLNTTNTALYNRPKKTVTVRSFGGMSGSIINDYYLFTV